VNGGYLPAKEEYQTRGESDQDVWEKKRNVGISIRNSVPRYLLRGAVFPRFGGVEKTILFAAGRPEEKKKLLGNGREERGQEQKRP